MIGELRDHERQHLRVRQRRRVDEVLEGTRLVDGDHAEQRVLIERRHLGALVDGDQRDLRAVRQPDLVGGDAAAADVGERDLRGGLHRRVLPLGVFLGLPGDRDPHRHGGERGIDDRRELGRVGGGHAGTCVSSARRARSSSDSSPPVWPLMVRLPTADVISRCSAIRRSSPASASLARQSVTHASLSVLAEPAGRLAPWSSGRIRRAGSAGGSAAGCSGGPSACFAASSRFITRAVISAPRCFARGSSICPSRSICATSPYRRGGPSRPAVPALRGWPAAGSPPPPPPPPPPPSTRPSFGKKDADRCRRPPAPRRRPRPPARSPSFFFLMIRRPPRSTLFPYPTPFRPSPAR